MNTYVFGLFQQLGDNPKDVRLLEIRVQANTEQEAHQQLLRHLKSAKLD